MAKDTSERDRLLQILRSVDLPHPDGQLLESFLEDSIDPDHTARYVLERYLTDKNILELAPLLSDWKRLVAIFVCDGPIHQLSEETVIANFRRRDGGRCCITGLRNTFWDPLIVAPISLSTDIQADESLHGLLGVFVGLELRDRLLQGAASLNVYQSHWLVRRSAAAAFAKGFFQFSFGKKLDFRVRVVTIGGPKFPDILDLTPRPRRGRFPDPASTGLDNPDVSTLQVLARFANAVRWSLVAQEIALRSKKIAMPSKVSPQGSFSEYGLIGASWLWHIFPTSVRVRAYNVLAFVGAYIYGPSCSMKVQRLPFGMYLKTQRLEYSESLANDYAALQLVRNHTQIPVPRPLDLVSNSDLSYLVITRTPGIHLGMCIDTLSDQEEETLVHDLKFCVGQLHEISKDVTPEYAITNAAGKACYDHRINAGLDYSEERGDFVGPFIDELQLNEILHCRALPNMAHKDGHKIVFTHSDLNMRNILMRNGRFSGIVDWENSGWYPEYWDYTKAHYITKINRRWLKIVDKVFNQAGNLDSELAIERQLWDYCF